MVGFAESGVPLAKTLDYIEQHTEVGDEHISDTALELRLREETEQDDRRTEVAQAGRPTGGHTLCRPRRVQRRSEETQEE